MDAQELRNLQEAYLEVVMNEEERPYPAKKVQKIFTRNTETYRI
jgi:hypothetical protein